MEFEQLLYETMLKSEQVIEKYIDIYTQNGYLADIKRRTLEEVEKLKVQNPQVVNNEYFMKEQLFSYLIVIIQRIKNEYSTLIPDDRMQKLDLLLEEKRILVINDSEDKHDFSADLETNQLIVNLNRMRGDDIYQKVINAKATLPHEIFHFVIQMLKTPENAKKRMVIDLINGNQIKSRGMVGFMLNEGFVEKYSTEFCARNNLYFAIAPQYIPFVNICNLLIQRNPLIGSSIFSLDYEDVLDNLNIEEKQAYFNAECISYGIRHKKLDPSQIINVKVEKVDKCHEK